MMGCISNWSKEHLIILRLLVPNKNTNKSKMRFKKNKLVYEIFWISLAVVRGVYQKSEIRLNKVLNW